MIHIAGPPPDSYPLFEILYCCLKSFPIDFFLLCVFNKWATYRVSRYSCHPLISVCARMENKKAELGTGLPLKLQSAELATPKMAEFITCHH